MSEFQNVLGSSLSLYNVFEKHFPIFWPIHAKQKGTITLDRLIIDVPFRKSCSLFNDSKNFTGDLHVIAFFVPCVNTRTVIFRPFCLFCVNDHMIFQPSIYIGKWFLTC